jgi:hypothetical protein
MKNSIMKNPIPSTKKEDLGMLPNEILEKFNS